MLRGDEWGQSAPIKGTKRHADYYDSSPFSPSLATVSRSRTPLKYFNLSEIGVCLVDRDNGVTLSVALCPKPLNSGQIT